MSETEQPKTPPNGEDESAEREAQAEDPTSPVRGFEDLEDAEEQAGQADED
jgi:hypothetical protein